MAKRRKKGNPSSWWAMPVGMGLGFGWLGLAGYTIYNNAKAFMSQNQGRRENIDSE